MIGEICEKILDYSNEKELWMNAYSRKLFTDLTDINSIQVDEEFLDKSQSICFVENQDITPYLPKNRYACSFSMEFVTIRRISFLQ